MQFWQEFLLMILGVVLTALVPKIQKWWQQRSRQSLQKALDRINAPDYRDVQRNLMLRLFNYAIFLIAAAIYFGITFQAACNRVLSASLCLLAMVCASFGAGAVPMTKKQRTEHIKWLRKQLPEKPPASNAV
jgi:hypothetical protein